MSDCKTYIPTYCSFKTSGMNMGMLCVWIVKCINISITLGISANYITFISLKWTFYYCAFLDKQLLCDSIALLHTGVRTA